MYLTKTSLQLLELTAVSYPWVRTQELFPGSIYFVLLAVCLFLLVHSSSQSQPFSLGSWSIFQWKTCSVNNRRYIMAPTFSAQPIPGFIRWPIRCISDTPIESIRTPVRHHLHVASASQSESSLHNLPTNQMPSWYLTPTLEYPFWCHSPKIRYFTDTFADQIETLPGIFCWLMRILPRLIS